MANQLRVTLISTELVYIVFAVSGFCSTIVNVRAFGIPKAFFHAKIPRATNPTYANKKLHNLFPISVHSLLDKRKYQCSTLLHLGFRNAPNHRCHPINLHQREQHPKRTLLSTLNERYVVRH